MHRLQVCPCLPQCIFHLPDRYRGPVIGDGIYLHKSPPSSRDPFHTVEPFQGSLADVVSHHPEDDSGVVLRGR
jgi:hypothetical protein